MYNSAPQRDRMHKDSALKMKRGVHRTATWKMYNLISIEAVTVYTIVVSPPITNRPQVGQLPPKQRRENSFQLSGMSFRRSISALMEQFKGPWPYLPWTSLLGGATGGISCFPQTVCLSALPPPPGRVLQPLI